MTRLTALGLDRLGMLRIGDRVTTSLGAGVVQGFEMLHSDRLRRAIVRLDDPERWAIKDAGDPAFFFDEVQR